MDHWSEEHKCLCDYMGLPITRTEAKEAIALLRAHLKRTPAQLAKIHNDLVAKSHPSMVKYLGERMPGDME